MDRGKSKKSNRSFLPHEQKKPSSTQSAFQPKLYPAGKPPARPKTSGIVQPYGWAILDSASADDPQIVRTNLQNAANYYTASSVSIDPERVVNPAQIRLGAGEVVHIHGHGTAAGLGGFAAASLAREVLRKFGLAALKGRTILLHGCQVGSGNFLTNFLNALANNNLQGWNKTRVLAPVNLMVVNEQGISMVAKNGVNAGQLTTRAGQRANVQRKGEGWAGIQVVANAIQAIPAGKIKEIVIVAMKREQSV